MNRTLDVPTAAVHIADRYPGARTVVEFADERHAGQRREVDGAPFVTHPVEVASILSEHDCPDHMVAAGLLHDVLEKSDTGHDELEARFGTRVAALVVALTDDPAITDEAERRAALRLQVAEAGDEAAAIFAADKISKVRELRHRADRGDLDANSLARLEHYRESCDMLEALLPGSALVSELRREMRALERMRAARHRCGRAAHQR
jgi:(p)ppGpp synthase/HD superfamily hydrolase